MGSYLVLCRVSLDQAAAWLAEGTVPEGHSVGENPFVGARRVTPAGTPRQG